MNKINSEIVKLFNYTVDYLNYKKKLCRFLNSNKEFIELLYLELYNSDFYKEIKCKTGSKCNFFDINMLNPMRAPLLYVICRVIKPEVIIETGVSNGFSSSLFLKALDENKKGTLFSIDLPNQHGEEIHNEVGWLVPQYLRNRWDLIIGSSKEKLPILLKKIEGIDLFYHDSDHSCKNVCFELNTVWDYVKPGGLLICDDVNTSTAFVDFSQKRKCENIKIFKNGIAMKHHAWMSHF